MAKRTRQEIYPDTDTFTFKNVNPRNRITGDCAFRAIANGLEKPWVEFVMEMAELSCKTGYAINDNKGIERYLKEQGWKKQKQPRKADNTKYTGKEFCYMIQGYSVDRNDEFIPISDRIVANIGGKHMVAIIDGKGEDIWNSTGGTIGNYWIK